MTNKLITQEPKYKLGEILIYTDVNKKKHKVGVTGIYRSGHKWRYELQVDRRAYLVSTYEDRLQRS